MTDWSVSMILVISILKHQKSLEDLLPHLSVQLLVDAEIVQGIRDARSRTDQNLYVR